MKHGITLIAFLICGLVAAAQDGLGIADAFKRYHRAHNATETIVKGEQLKGTGLQTYRSLILTDISEDADNLANTVVKDGTNALSREVKYVDGKLYYAQYMLKPKNGRNRYIFYVNSFLKGGDKVMLVYMDGNASYEQIKKLIRQ